MLTYQLTECLVGSLTHSGYTIIHRFHEQRRKDIDDCPHYRPLAVLHHDETGDEGQSVFPHLRHLVIHCGGQVFGDVGNGEAGVGHEVQGLIDGSDHCCLLLLKLAQESRDKEFRLTRKLLTKTLGQQPGRLDGLRDYYYVSIFQDDL